MAERPEYSPGLAGVIAGESAISRIDFERNRLILRGYDVADLTGRGCFEETAWLLLYGDLPTPAQLAGFQERLRSERGLPPMVEELLLRTPAEAHSMAVLRSAVSALGATDPEARDIGREATLRKAERLLAKIPTILASAHRCAAGLEPVPPDPALGHAANLLYMVHGRPPEESAVRALDVSLVLYAEHGFNASSFAARVAASTLADLHAAVTAGIAALMGPLHGGANEAAMEMIPGHRRAGAGAAVGAGGAGGQASDHGLRPPRVQARRLAGAGHEGRGPPGGGGLGGKPLDAHRRGRGGDGALREGDLPERRLPRVLDLLHDGRADPPSTRRSSWPAASPAGRPMSSSSRRATA